MRTPAQAALVVGALGVVFGDSMITPAIPRIYSMSLGDGECRIPSQMLSSWLRLLPV